MIDTLPKTCRKKYLQKIFFQENEKELRKLINRVIAEKRNLPVDAIKYTKTIRINEVAAIMVELGYEVKKETATV